MKILKPFTLLALLAIIACKPKVIKEGPLDLLYNQVIEIHDEVMPLMGDMNKNSVLLKSAMEEHPTLPDSMQIQIRSTITNLENTADAMMEWMSEFRKPDFKNEQQANIYLEAEKLKIRKVSKVMNMSFERSGELLQNINQNQ